MEAKTSNKASITLLSLIVVINFIYTVFITFIIPQIAESYSDYGSALSPLMQNVMMQSHLSQRYLLLSLPITVAVLAGLIMLVIKLGSKRWVIAIFSVLFGIKLLNLLGTIAIVVMEHVSISSGF